MARRRSDDAFILVRLPGGTVPWAVATGVVVVAGVAAVVFRPLAPDLGSVPDPARWFAPPLLQRISDYRVPVRQAAIAGVLIDVALTSFVALTARGRSLVARIVALVGAERPVRAAAAVVAAVVAATTIARLPIAVWRHLHARAFGLSTQSLAGWAGDWSIELGILCLSVTLAALAGYGLMARWPQRWLLMAAPAGLIVVASATLAAPVVIEPLRFDVVALPDGPVRAALEPVLDAAGRPDATLLVADASRRTTRQNAYVAGVLGTQRIVLYDTLLERPPAQVALVVAHELSHQRNRDLLRGILGSTAGLWLLCALVDGVLRRRVRHGRQRYLADPHGAAVVVAVIVIALFVAAPVASWASRRAEAAADIGALELTGETADYCAAQRGLVERNLSDPAPPTWARLWWWTHPPAASRLELGTRVGGDRC